MYILFKMFVLCYFCIIDMYIFDKINVLYFTLRRRLLMGTHVLKIDNNLISYFLPCYWGNFDN